MNIKPLAAIVCAAFLLSGCAIVKTADYYGYDTDLISSQEKATKDIPSEKPESDTDTAVQSKDEKKAASSKAEKKAESSKTEKKTTSSNKEKKAASSAASKASASKAAVSSKASSNTASESTSSQQEENTSSDITESAPEEESSGETMNTVCYSSLFYSLDDDELLYSDTIDGSCAPASLTKLLTAAVVLKYVDPNEIVTVGTEQYLVNAGSSVCNIAIGNRLTVYDLLTGMLMSSGNDAAYTAAVTTARSVYGDEELSDQEAVERFCGLMNELAGEIGMTDSYFTTPDGWDDGAQHTTASDLLKLAKYTLDIPEIRSIAGTFEKSVIFDSGENLYWTNTNYLLNPYSAYYCADCIGTKTGTTGSAGACLIATFEKDGKTYISVVTGCYSDTDRFDLTLELYRKFCK